MALFSRATTRFETRLLVLGRLLADYDRRALSLLRHSPVPLLKVRPTRADTTFASQPTPAT